MMVEGRSRRRTRLTVGAIQMAANDNPVEKVHIGDFRRALTALSKLESLSNE